MPVPAATAPRHAARRSGRGLLIGAGALVLAALVLAAALMLALPKRPAVLPPAPDRAALAAHAVVNTAVNPGAFAREAMLPPAALMARWEPEILRAAKRFDVPAAWIRTVMRAESGGRTWLAEGVPMVSDKGAQGLMQVMPQTYAEMRAAYGLGADPFDPHDNIQAGAAYLRWLHGKYGYPAMFAAYNDGPGNLEDYLLRARPLPQETRLYVTGITRALGSGADWLARQDSLRVTAPDGTVLQLDRTLIRSVRAALPGEYAPGVAAVIDMGRRKQGVRESPAALAAVLGPLRPGGI